MPSLTTFIRRLCCLLLAPLAVACTPLYFSTLNSGDPAGAPISVQPVAGQSLQMDIYRPPSRPQAAPVVVFLYGGRWQSGSRRDYAFVGERLAAAGVVTMLPDYRLYPAAHFPEFVEDAAAAVAWARAHAVEFGGDPQRVFVAGHSAGAHIAALLGTDARYLAAQGLTPRDLAGVIGIAGPYDFLPLEEDDLIQIFGSDAAAQAASQPVNFVDGDEPPFLLLHGDADLLVWLRNSQRLRARFASVHAQAELKPYPGVGHIRILAALRYPALAPTRADLLRFVSETPAAHANRATAGATH